MWLISQRNLPWVSSGRACKSEGKSFNNPKNSFFEQPKTGSFLDSLSFLRLFLGLPFFAALRFLGLSSTIDNAQLLEWPRPCLGSATRLPMFPLDSVPVEVELLYRWIVELATPREVRDRRRTFGHRRVCLGVRCAGGMQQEVLWPQQGLSRA